MPMEGRIRPVAGSDSSGDLNFRIDGEYGPGRPIVRCEGTDSI